MQVLAAGAKDFLTGGLVFDLATHGHAGHKLADGLEPVTVTDTALCPSSQTNTFSGISNAASGAASITPAPTAGFPNMTSFESGHLHTSSFGYAAVIDDVEDREAPIRHQTPQSVDGLWDGLAAGFGDDPVRRLRVVWHQGSFK
jgi:hypothetical protein